MQPQAAITLKVTNLTPSAVDSAAALAQRFLAGVKNKNTLRRQRTNLKSSEAKGGSQRSREWYRRSRNQRSGNTYALSARQRICRPPLVCRPVLSPWQVRGQVRCCFLAFRLLGGGVPGRPVSAMIFGLVLGQRLAGMFDDCPEQWSTVPSWRHSTNYVNDDNNPAYGVPIDNSDGSDYSCLDGGYDQTLPDWKDYRRLNPLGLARMGGSNLSKDRKGYAY